MMALNLVSPAEMKGILFLDSTKSNHFHKLSVSGITAFLTFNFLFIFALCLVAATKKLGKVLLCVATSFLYERNSTYSYSQTITFSSRIILFVFTSVL